MISAYDEDKNQMATSDKFQRGNKKITKSEREDVNKIRNGEKVNRDR